MSEFLDIINKKLKEVSFMTSFEGHPDYRDDARADFDYLPLGGLTLLFEDETVYCLADFFSTSLGTYGIGLKKMDEFKRGPSDDTQSKKWNDKIGKSVTLARIYWSKEGWNNRMLNEFYPESVELLFGDEAVFYFCGDVDDFNFSENRYNLLSGRDSGLIFYSRDAFKKYTLDKVHKVEEITARTTK